MGLYRSSGKHAAPRAGAQRPSRQAAGSAAHHPTHAAMTRVPGPAQPKATEPGAADGEQNAA
ncbi:MAG TPA: hypothetical protein VH589_17060 [Trebonia sp.]